ncbi:NACHT, LRR and PYD domains-containing protein 12-like [Branchiostoma lanceolatum]|uniref:NACHT, LRR and PYD domains-containing protein 12-like n=1 Tax=Branchiostoma lanceolatum TaxID=7740 RepID=UPI0034556B38
MAEGQGAAGHSGETAGSLQPSTSQLKTKGKDGEEFPVKKPAPCREEGLPGGGIRKYFYFIKEKVSSDWKDLAFHLRFEQADIDNIDGRNRDDKSRCMDLLEEWLKRNGERATIEVLMEALSEATLQSVVDGLRKVKLQGTPGDVMDVITCLKDLYATEYAHVRPLPWCEDLNLPLGEVYTNLQLQHRDSRGRFEDTDTIVSLADIYKTDEAVSQEVNPRSAVRKIRVEGPPGIGKSCSCQKLAHDWSSGKLGIFKAVFFLELRHLSGSVKDAIFEQLLPRDMKVTPDQLWSYIEENQNDVLFILDGLDELSQTSRKGTDVVDLIQGKILRNCHVLVTSRPYQCVKDLEKCHEFYKIVGYSKENSVQFIRKYFSKTPDSATKLEDHLKSNENLSEIAVNPLNNILICVVWEDSGEKLPASKAELYQMIVYSVAKRYCGKNGVLFEGEQFPPNIEEALRGLGKLAWEGLWRYQLQFKVDDIRTEHGFHADDMLNMGLLTRDYSFASSNAPATVPSYIRPFRSTWPPTISVTLSGTKVKET